YRLRKHDGQYCWILDDGCPRYNSSGEFLGYIGHCLDITENKRREAEIARTLSLLRSTMESTADGIMVADGKGKMVRSNIKFREMWGITESIIESKDENAAINFVLDQLKEPEIFLNIVHNLYATPEKISFDEVELKDGRMVERYSQPQWIGDKVVGRVWSFRDITERRKAEDKIKNLLIEKETILKEVHHRIKNNMSTIFNLLDLQAGELKEPSAIRSLEDAGSRVLSMLVLYEKLYKSTGFQEISVVDYIPELVDQIISNFPDNKLVKIDKKIDDFILDATRLQPLGIIINELLTNIMKYAFTGKDDRWIRICATLNDNLVSFVIEDNGNGMPELIDFENSTGFGLMLVRMLTEQLRGTVRIERGNGTRIVLEFEK
ncbi:MAG: histidine kinase dimerization/phosphoacceptor domain -containing protein, partial [Methanococcaceae archaeon]